MIDRTRHPVWSVYDLYRTARLNVKYYSARLHRLDQRNFFLEMVIAITAPSSAVAGLWLWNTPWGSNAWKILGIVAAVAAVLKPLLNLPKRITVYTEVLAGNRALEHDLFEIKEMVVQKGKYDGECQRDYKYALKRDGALAVKDPETKQDKKLIRRLTQEVNQELPPQAFFVPPQ